MNEKISEQLSTSPDRVVLTRAQLSTCAASADVQSSITPPRRRILQNHQLVWLNADIDESNVFYQNAIIQLHTVVNSIDTFIDSDQCVDYLTDIVQEKVFMIVSKNISEEMIPLIYDISQLDAIYIFSENITKEELFEDRPKVKGQYTKIASICEAIRQAVRRCDQNAIPISFVPVDIGTSDPTLDELDSSFMYTQVFKEILLDAEYNQTSIKDLVVYWHLQYIDNEPQSKVIDEFERDYRSNLSIRWYTRDSFTYGMLNRALRILETDIIIKMGFFIRDLHRQLEELHAKQFGGNNATSFTVYRGQGLSNKDFEKLMKTKGGLMSFNSFLSTSEDSQTSRIFAESNLANPGEIGILFKITVDPSISSTPYALISDFSYFKKEKEILFSMHSVFRIGGIEKIDDNNDRLYQVELKLTADDDQQLRALTNRIREETYPTEKGWYRISILLIKLDQFHQAEEICMAAQEELSDDIEKAYFYSILGRIKDGQGDYEKAFSYYEKVVEIAEKTLTPNDPDLAAPYNSIAIGYVNKGEYSMALSFFQKALGIKQKVLPADDPSLSMFYNNISRVYNKMGEYGKAISFSEHVLKIQQDHLPPNHPDLATFHTSIAETYEKLGEYAKARRFLDKALRILEKILSKNHSRLAIAYNNIAVVYSCMGEYFKAIPLYEKALKIHQEILSPNHPSLASYYSNIGGAYTHMGEYSKALSSHEKALRIRKKALPLNHPDLATSYNNIGGVYDALDQFLKALFYYEKAIEIKQIALPSTRPDLPISYSNIGSIYIRMGQYSKALSFYEKALDIQLDILPENHPDLAISYDNIGSIYIHTGEHSKADLFYEKALKIQQDTLPQNNHRLATSFNNMGWRHYHIGEYSKALSFFEKALKIQQATLPENHPELVTSFSNIGSVYKETGKYSQALSFFEKAKEILRKTFEPDNYTTVNLYHNICEVYLHLKKYSKALPFYEEELKILENKLSANHPSLLPFYKDISIIYLWTNEYSTALSFNKRALQISENFLPAGDIILQVLQMIHFFLLEKISK